MGKAKAAQPRYSMGQNTWYMIRTAWIAKEKKVLVFCILSALLAVAVNLILLYVSPSILSVVERKASAAELLWTIAVFVLLLMIVSACAAYVKSNELYGRITVRRELINQVNHKMLTTAYPNLYDEKFKKLKVKAYETIENNYSASEAIWTTLTELMANILGFVFYVMLMSSVQPLLLIVILATTISSYYITKQADAWSYHHREEIAESEKHIFYLNECAGNIVLGKDIRIFGLRPWIEALYRRALETYTAFIKKAKRRVLWARIADLLLTFLRNGVAYAYLIGLVMGEHLEVAEFLLYFSAVGGFTSWVSGILGNLGTLHKQSLDISNLRECLEYPDPFLYDEGEHIETGRTYEIQLENVSFRYPEAEADTLSNINFTLQPGEKLAVVGLNGAGKTTLVKILCGFLDPTQGRVLLNGKDIREYNRREYYDMFAAVFQNFSLLAGTIAVNVAQQLDGIDMERVKDSIEKAGLRSKIESLKKGYDTDLNREVYDEAVQLSGGEMQRLMLARALYKKAEFVILDEPTAALDPIAESQMYQKYNEMTRGRSSVYISHRLASTRFCDRILMIADGKIAEEGTHDELIELGGKYAELYEVQSQYYKEGGAEDGEKDIME